MILMAPMVALAQEDVPEPIQIPSVGYEHTDTIPADDPWKYYVVHADVGQEITYEFQVIGDGEISIFLSKIDDPLNYYTQFSTPQPVTSFSKTFPPDFGFSRDYFIQVNSTSGIDVQYSVKIHTEQTPTKNYTLYYVLIILGFVALVVFSYKFVERQDRKEREAKKQQRRGKNRK